MGCTKQQSSEGIGRRTGSRFTPQRSGEEKGVGVLLRCKIFVSEVDEGLESKATSRLCHEVVLEAHKLCVSPPAVKPSQMLQNWPQQRTKHFRKRKKFENFRPNIAQLKWVCITRARQRPPNCCISSQMLTFDIPCSLPSKDMGVQSERYHANNSTFCRECGEREQEAAILIFESYQKKYH